THSRPVGKGASLSRTKPALRPRPAFRSGRAGRRRGTRKALKKNLRGEASQSLPALTTSRGVEPSNPWVARLRVLSRAEMFVPGGSLEGRAAGAQLFRLSRDRPLRLRRSLGAHCGQCRRG